MYNKNSLSIINLRDGKIIATYEVFNPKVFGQELLIRWLENNTILLTSNKTFMSLIKFCSEVEDMGVCVNPERVLNLFK